MKSVEIVITILAIFLSRLEVSSDLFHFTALCRHFVFSCSLTIKMTVLTKTTANPTNGAKILLMAKDTLSMLSRLPVETKPKRVLFLIGKNFKPKLLTQYTGETLHMKVVKMHTTAIETLLDVTMVFT